MPIQLKIQKREKLGSRESRRLRRSGFVPGVIYGSKEAEVSIKVETHMFMSTIGFAKSLGIVELEMNGKTLKSIIKEIQWDTLYDKPLHLDFQIVSDNQLVAVPVPVRLSGTPLGVSIDGGILDHAMYEVEVTVKAANIPSELIFDVSEMRLHDRLHLSEVTLPEGMSVDLAGDPVIASVIAPKILKVAEEEVEEGEEGEEGAEGEAGAAAAPAEEGAK